MARTRHEILVAGRTTKRPRRTGAAPRPDDGAAVGAHRSLYPCCDQTGLCGVDDPSPGSGCPNTHTLCFCGRRRSVRVLEAALASWRCLGSTRALWPLRIHKNQAASDEVDEQLKLFRLFDKQAICRRPVLMELRAAINCPACFLVSYRPLLAFCLIPKRAKQGRRSADSCKITSGVSKRVPRIVHSFALLPHECCRGSHAPARRRRAEPDDVTHDAGSATDDATHDNALARDTSGADALPALRATCRRSRRSEERPPASVAAWQNDIRDLEAAAAAPDSGTTSTADATARSLLGDRDAVARAALLEDAAAALDGAESENDEESRRSTPRRRRRADGQLLKKDNSRKRGGLRCARAVWRCRLAPAASTRVDGHGR